MWLDALLAYFHFAAIFALVWFLAVEWNLLAAGAGALAIDRLARTDGRFGLSAGLVFLTGAARALYGLKGWSFYAHNPAFHLKIGLFVLVGLISILPTVMFLRWRKAQRADAAFRAPEAQWRRARLLVIVELHLVALIPLAAVIMARGLR